MTTELQLHRPAGLQFTQEQEDMIRGKYAPGASPAEFAVLMEIAKTRKLNPITSQIYFINRGGKWSVQVGIDGLRALAERSGLYAGQDEPEFEEEGGRIKLCKVRVYRKDWGARACVGVAYWDEYGARASNPLWKTLPHGMLAKVAEALALRKAFPEDTSGLYTSDEMDRDATPSRYVAAIGEDIKKHGLVSVVNGMAVGATIPHERSVALLEALDFIDQQPAEFVKSDFAATGLASAVTDPRELEELRAAYLRKVAT
jgi:phage recombination protein Bet